MLPQSKPKLITNSKIILQRLAKAHENKENEVIDTNQLLRKVKHCVDVFKDICGMLFSFVFHAL